MARQGCWGLQKLPWPPPNHPKEAPPAVQTHRQTLPCAAGVAAAALTGSLGLQHAAACGKGRGDAGTQPPGDCSPYPTPLAALAPCIQVGRLALLCTFSPTHLALELKTKRVLSAVIAMQYALPAGWAAIARTVFVRSLHHPLHPQCALAPAHLDLRQRGREVLGLEDVADAKQAALLQLQLQLLPVLLDVLVQLRHRRGARSRQTLF